MLREATITIEGGRDAGKAFMIREMSAIPADKWFTRVLMLLARAGSEIPSHILTQGAAGVAALGIGAVMAGVSKAPWSEVEPLLDEMLNRCVVGYQQANGQMVMNQPISVIGSQIEEVSTIIRLREEILSLHLGFSLRAKILSYIEMGRAMVETSNGLNTETSQGLSE